MTPCRSAALDSDGHSQTLSPIDMLQAATDVDIVNRVDLPARLPRYRASPAAFARPAMLGWIKAMTGREDLSLHQSLSLEAIAEGRDLVVATGTVSGKSLIYQAAAIDALFKRRAITLALYPLKALASDQMMHWRRALTAAGLPLDLVAEITGDTPMGERNEALDRARIIIATPDVIHSWLMRQIAAPAVRKFLRELRFLILDETHVLESELGSNCAFLIRRLQAAQLRVRKSDASTQHPFQIIATTATIAHPADHLERLSGRDFAVISEHDNGAPAAKRTIVHIDGPAHGAGAERMVAGIATELADKMGDAAFIIFHDSRQGVERITLMIDRDDVLPYRSGYEAADRRRIEHALRQGDLRGVVATSSLELGIDIPQFAIGFTVGIPNSRKTFRQRMGRVGRTRPALFAVIAPAVSFAQLGSSLEEFSAGEAEPSPLYLDNRFIQFAQARCLIEECEAFDETATLPAGVIWPRGFDRAFAMAMPGAARPRDLDMIAAIGADAPHLNYPLRHVCETNYTLKDVASASDRFGTIGQHQAIREAYPGATYYHLGQACKIREWRSSSFERSVRLERVRSAEPTMPLLRKQVNVLRAGEDSVPNLAGRSVGVAARIDKTLLPATK